MEQPRERGTEEAGSLSEFSLVLRDEIWLGLASLQFSEGSSKSKMALALVLGTRPPARFVADSKIRSPRRRRALTSRFLPHWEDIRGQHEGGQFWCI